MGAKAGFLTPRDVFGDVQNHDTAAASSGLAIGGPADMGVSTAGGGDGTIKSHRPLKSQGASAAASPALTARSDVFDFLATPRTNAALFGPPQV